MLANGGCTADKKKEQNVHGFLITISFQLMNSLAKLCNTKARTSSNKQKAIMKLSSPFSSHSPTATVNTTSPFSALFCFIVISRKAKDFGVAVHGDFLSAYLSIVSLKKRESKYKRLWHCYELPSPDPCSMPYRQQCGLQL